jgi:cytochrome c5
MKKSVKMIAVIACACLFTALIAHPVSAQTAEKSAATSTSLPADVAKVVDKSCAHCHMEPGNQMALSRVNFTKWDSYDPAKQASKAALIAKEVSKGKMPPKGYKKDNPDKVPTEADIKVISDWSKSLQPK